MVERSGLYGCLAGGVRAWVLQRFSTPAQLAGVALLGALGFYLVRTLSDSLGEQQILSPFVSASLPYLLVMMATAFLSKSKIKLQMGG